MSKEFEVSKTRLQSEWIRSSYRYSYYNYECKNCGCYEYSQINTKGVCELMKYCPKCGAKMINGNGGTRN